MITTSSNPTSTTSSAAATSTSSSGLSTGAQAGIGVGVAAGAIAAGAVGLFFFWRRRRSNKTNKGYDATNTNPSGNGHGNDPNQWRGDQAYAAQQGYQTGGWTAEQKPPGQGIGYGNEQMAMQPGWNPAMPVTVAQTGELENTERRTPVELSSTTQYHELDTPGRR
ncbi:hypothetical protein EG329_004068 [Mollisiaceae sp. DMI_Dod_QoI]|nr:hypothetical protein EG329_004068 [Helotiales sp. DMI_Dod_QoI]